MATLIDPTSVAFLLAENRTMPMHVGALQLYEPPDGADASFPRWIYEQMLDVPEVAPIFLRRPHRSARTLGQWTWVTDDQFDLEFHVRHSALPQPGRVRELLELCSRLHGTRLARERPLWESHLIEGLNDGRFAMYTKLHHALVDGIAAMRLLQSMLSDDPDSLDAPAPWSAQRSAARSGRAREDAQREAQERADRHENLVTALSGKALSTGLGLLTEAAGMPGALVRTLQRGLRDETSAVSYYAPRTIFNTTITGARRFAAEGWPLERLRAIADASGTTLNDVVLAMCGGAVRAYLRDLGELPDHGLVAMVPIGLKAKDVGLASASGGNAVGAVMVRLGTELADPAARLRQVHDSMDDGKDALSSMTPHQVVAMSALGMAPAMVVPLLGMQGMVRPPFNLIISNVPGPQKPLYLNGSKMVGSYPLSIPIQGMALNITCASYDGSLGFGLTGCRRSVPHLQRLLTHLDDEVVALEDAVGA